MSFQSQGIIGPPPSVDSAAGPASSCVFTWGSDNSPCVFCSRSNHASCVTCISSCDAGCCSSSSSCASGCRAPLLTTGLSPAGFAPRSSFPTSSLPVLSGPSVHCTACLSTIVLILTSSTLTVPLGKLRGSDVHVFLPFLRYFVFAHAPSRVSYRPKRSQMITIRGFCKRQFVR